MSQDLVRNLLAAGSTSDAEGVQYLLFVDPHESFLNCQHWKGDTVAKQELLVDSVRPNSTAAYIITPTEKLAICITPSSNLSAYTYDQEEREWVESEESPIAGRAVHPNGKLVAGSDATGRFFVVFQDPSGRLISLDDAWNSTILPASPVAGTPISTLSANVFYISATDNFIHVLVRGSDGTWKDKVVIKYSFTEEIKAFCMGNKESYVLTGKNILLNVTAEGEKKQIGKAKDGKFVPETTEEAGRRRTYWPNGRLKSDHQWW